MAGVMDSVNQRTQLVGQNRLELLLFRLDGQQLYGINVFKVREVLQCPKLTLMPKSSPVVCGVANIRGATIPILDLAMATGSGRLLDQVLEELAAAGLVRAVDVPATSALLSGAMTNGEGMKLFAHDPKLVFGLLAVLRPESQVLPYLSPALSVAAVNGPQDELFDWDAVDWRACEQHVRRLRQRIFLTYYSYVRGLMSPTSPLHQRRAALAARAISCSIERSGGGWTTTASSSRRYESRAASSRSCVSSSPPVTSLR